ncbi:MAG: hypothetical protein H0V66_03170 [Bdellovibrionales bacterium]|nr:hypothetical protein [Bdellovibrionales bacterium]
MGRLFPLKFQSLPIFALLSALFLSFNFCPDLWAAQDAIVTEDQAVIYADEQMSAPVGFVRKGKKIKVGDISRNRAQVYPIIVSGKIAYIRVIDVSTAKETVDSKVLVAERFQKGANRDEEASNFAVSIFNFSSQIMMDKQNDVLKDKDPVNWFGASVRGGVKANDKWDFDMILTFMNAKAEKEVFRAVEFGFGGAARIYDKSRFKVRALGQVMAIPFASYALAEEFRVIGYGFTAGGGLSMAFRLGKNFGLEGFGGVYYTKLAGFRTPDPYQDIAPSFIGTRLGIGLNYVF